MTAFEKAVVSVPGRERIATTPFGSRVIIHATAADTNGAMGIWETHVPPGHGPAPHMHTRETEVFRVLEGVYRFRCGEEEFEVGAGAVVVLPPNVPHGWRNISDKPGRMFAFVAPGGFEQLFIDIEASNADTPEKIAVIEARLGLVNEATEALKQKA